MSWSTSLPASTHLLTPTLTWRLARFYAATTQLVRRGHLDGIDDQDLNGACPGLEFQT
jgi:hypothetical protein